MKGKVQDQNGVALSGATIRIILSSNERSKTVISDKGGDFVIENVPQNAKIEVYYLGYGSRTLLVKPDMGVIQLEAVTNVIEEAVINRGYYTTSKILNTGSVGSVGAEDLEKQPVTNVMQGLQGRVAGVNVVQSNGYAGSGVNIQIRGQNSIDAGNSPLYIIDGVPISDVPVDRQSSGGYINIPNGGNSPLNTLNPADIENIEILKDADATAIYGSRGANGVILITTKKGIIGKSTLDLNINQGFAQVTRYPKMLALKDYLDLRREAFANDGITPDAANAPDLTVWSQTEGRDWPKELIGNTSSISDFALALSGGDQRNRYLVRGTYRREGSVFPIDKFSYKRGGVHFNYTHNSSNDRFTLGLTGMYNKDNNLLPHLYTPPFNFLYLPPNLPIYNEDGKYFYSNEFTNPFAGMNAEHNAKSATLQSNLSLKYKIGQGIDFLINSGYTRMDISQVATFPLSASNPAYAYNFAMYSIDQTQSFITEPQLQYGKEIGSGSLNVLLGGTYQQSDFQKPFQMIGNNYPNDSQLKNINAAGEVSSLTSASSKYKYISVFGRASYDWKKRYVVNATLRRDGSSRFGPENRFGTFGALGLAWVLSNEEFLQESSWLSLGKIRASYGTNGNDQTSDNIYKDAYSSNNYTYGGLPGYIPSRIYNPYFNWEKTRKLEFAADLGFFKDRIGLTINWFESRSSNMITDIPLTPQVGFSYYMGNLDALVRNNGWEFDLNTKNVTGEKFSWQSNFNLTILQNKLLAMDGLESSIYRNQFAIGKPLSAIPLYQFTGFNDGIAQFVDQDNNGSIAEGLAVNGSGDQVILGQSSPYLYGGFSNTFSYANLHLDIFFHFMKQDGYDFRYYQLDYNYDGRSMPGFFNNQPAFVGTPEIPVTQMSGTEIDRGYQNYTRSDAMLVNASFIRLKNVQLAYDFQQNWLQKAGISKCRVFTNAQNLFTITKYKGFDPETFNQMPPMRVINFGVQLSF
ncbi:SusC/RagA family TonB-linked outer membrane protein [Sphingobacterium faecale]|uniref:SusC/RagA family TonB-linked outer membrane protein n=1 Tax=Sphingobacterium faecale TaxID=2803775 RepID=A0ABS1R5R2_9SPHI|nr:SusC/RagA family TonB-linked outer membrane protein [Sphingobacterium faecale]MBL1410046.1 SusC/RagA family TonB-linked outer membrane protein [Sphingobacterium faecale]